MSSRAETLTETGIAMPLRRQRLGLGAGACAAPSCRSARSARSPRPAAGRSTGSSSSSSASSTSRARQRTSASHADRRPPAEGEDRLVDQRQLVRGRALRSWTSSSTLRAQLAGAGARRTARGGWPPAPLARYIATSASRSSASGSALGVARDRDADAREHRDFGEPSGNGLLERVEHALAERDRLGLGRRGPRRGSRTRRRRAARPCRCRASARRGARRSTTSSWSPTSWPRLSLTALNLSRSMNSIATTPFAAVQARERLARRGPSAAGGWAAS